MRGKFQRCVENLFLMALSPTPPPTKVIIPEALRLQLEAFRRDLWRVKIAEAVAAGVIGLLVSFLLVYGLDRFFQTSGWVRLGILVGGISLFAGFAPYWLHRWVWRQRREMDLARLIAKRYPGLGDRLLGVVELQNQTGNADSLSPRLREAAMEAVAAEAGKRSLAEALPPQRHRRWAWVAVGLAGISGTAFVVTPRAGLNAFQRWLMPFSETERYTFTRLVHPPTSLAVPFGEAFTFQLRLADDSDQRPTTATGRYGLQPPVEARLEKATFRFTFPGQQDPGTIVCRVGDLRHEIRIQPVPRPSMESIFAHVTAPSYLKIPEKVVDLKTGVLSAVEGSQVRIELIPNRPLASGTYGPTRAQVIEESTDGSPEFSPMEGALEISSRAAKTPLIQVGMVPFEIPFSWQDQLGLVGDSGFKVRVDAQRDASPTIYLQGIDRQKVMLPEETVDFEVLVEDDFGIKEMGIVWDGQSSQPGSGPPAKGELKLADGAVEERRINKNAAFSPVAFGIAPQKLTLRGYSEDHFPSRGRVYSEPITLFILTRDEHAQMLKAKFDRNITEFEDLARRELELLDETERLERLTGEELKQEDAAKRLDAQEQAESETKRRMEDLTERMEELMKDAARNGDIKKDTLKKMAESLKSMQELAEQDVPKVQEKLGDAQDSTNAPEKSEKDMQEAAAAQKKAVEKMQEALAKANDANKQFEAGTFINRLKKAATDQSGIARSMIDSFEKILGVKAAVLDPADQRHLGMTMNLQANTASDVRWLQEDLTNYFARTKTDSFKEILEEMRASRIDSGLETVQMLISKNHSFLATEDSKKWAEQLAAWAKKLEGDAEKNGDGGGDGGGKNPEDEDFEFMLRVMKLIQKEQDVRAQTRVLEQLRRTGAAKPEAKDVP